MTAKKWPFPEPVRQRKKSRTIKKSQKATNAALCAGTGAAAGYGTVTAAGFSAAGIVGKGVGAGMAAGPAGAVAGALIAMTVYALWDIFD